MMQELSRIGVQLRARQPGSIVENRSAIDRVADITLELIAPASPAHNQSAVPS
jgi:hypothetical protein